MSISKQIIPTLHITDLTVEGPSGKNISSGAKYLKFLNIKRIRVFIKNAIKIILINYQNKIFVIIIHKKSLTE